MEGVWHNPFPPRYFHITDSQRTHFAFGNPSCSIRGVAYGGHHLQHVFPESDSAIAESQTTRQALEQLHPYFFLEILNLSRNRRLRDMQKFRCKTHIFGFSHS